MATFTMTLSEVMGEDDQNYHEVGLTEYPIFDEEYRARLNKKIVDHFWLQEIGQETPSVFRHFMKRRMNEIMPMYNQLYESELIKFDPLQTINIKTLSRSESLAKQKSEGETNSAGHSESGSTSDAKSRAVASETPQTMLAGNGDYATSAQDNVSETGATSTAEETSSNLTSETGETEQTGNTDSETSGFQGLASDLIIALRQSFLNVDMMILEELQNLFMLVWSNGDEYSDRNLSNAYFYGLGWRF